MNSLGVELRPTRAAAAAAEAAARRPTYSTIDGVNVKSLNTLPDSPVTSSEEDCPADHPRLHALAPTLRHGDLPRDDTFTVTIPDDETLREAHRGDASHRAEHNAGRYNVLSSVVLSVDGTPCSTPSRA